MGSLYRAGKIIETIKTQCNNMCIKLDNTSRMADNCIGMLREMRMDMRWLSGYFTGLSERKGQPLDKGYSEQ